MTDRYLLTGLVSDLEDMTAKRGIANVLRMRKPEEVTCWVLHQNGFDWQETNPKRDQIKANFQIWSSGKITQNAHVLARLKSGSNGANKCCISIEFDGNFEGNAGEGNFWQPAKYGKNTLTIAQVMSARRLIRSVNALLPSLRGMFAHRQFGVNKHGKANRPICPGHEIWTHVGEWAVHELGMTDGGPGFCVAGMPIPDDWRGQYMQDQ